MEVIMSTITNYLEIKNLANANSGYFDAIYNGIYKYARDSIINNKISEVVSEFKKLSKEFERIGNRLKINEEEKRKAYCFGEIASLTRLMLELSEALNSVASIEGLYKDYPILKPTLKAIARHTDISGTKLREELGLSASSLSNFINRIREYNLIIIHKVGRSNYYSLSAEGKKALSIPDDSSYNENGEQLSLKFTLQILDSITKEMRNDQPNSISVLTESSHFKYSINEKNILKSKIDAVFSSRDTHFRNKFLRDIRSDSQSSYWSNYELPYSESEDNDIFITIPTY